MLGRGGASGVGPTYMLAAKLDKPHISATPVVASRCCSAARSPACQCFPPMRGELGVSTDTPVGGRQHKGTPCVRG